MKRMFLLLTFIGALSVSSGGFAKPPKHTTKTIKYENGDKYVGTIRIWKVNGKKMKYRDGNGIMYYANGNRFEGTWEFDSPADGTVYYANGNIFKGFFKDGVPSWGQFVFAHQGSIKLGDKLWEYPVNSSFQGDIVNGRIYTGRFDCLLTTTTGDRFTGTIKARELDKGTIVFANGDTFEGSFNSSAPSSGKYRYGKKTEIVGTTYKWIVPAGCTFNGNVRTFTGTVDRRITDINGNQFIGKLAAGQPDEGTMSFANGTTETGKWHDGMSPSEYMKQEAERMAKQEAERKRQEAEQKRQEAIKLRKNLETLEKKTQRLLAGNRDWDWVSFETIEPKDDLWPGAVFKLSQLFIGKKVSCNSQVYTCKDIRKTESGIEMSYTGKDGRSQTFNFNTIVFTCNPANITSIATNYPNNLGRIFYYAYNNVSHNKCYLISDQQNIPTYIKDYYIRKFGNVYGMAVMNKQVKLGMTLEMVQEIYGEGEVTRHVELGREIIVLTYGGYYNSFFGFSKIRTYTFINNRLTEYSE